MPVFVVLDDAFLLPNAIPARRTGMYAESIGLVKK